MYIRLCFLWLPSLLAPPPPHPPAVGRRRSCCDLFLSTQALSAPPLPPPLQFLKGPSFSRCPLLRDCSVPVCRGKPPPPRVSSAVPRRSCPPARFHLSLLALRRENPGKPCIFSPTQPVPLGRGQGHWHLPLRGLIPVRHTMGACFTIFCSPSSPAPPVPLLGSPSSGHHGCKMGRTCSPCCLRDLVCPFTSVA